MKRYSLGAVLLAAGICLSFSMGLHGQFWFGLIIPIIPVIALLLVIAAGIIGAVQRGRNRGA